MKFVLPVNPRARKAQHDFLSQYHAALNSAATFGGHNSGSKNKTHCHSNTSGYIRDKGAANPHAKVVFLGVASYYHVMHSCIVAHDDSEFLVDTFDEGEFKGGEYHFVDQTVPRVCDVYACHTIADLKAWAAKPFDGSTPAMTNPPHTVPRHSTPVLHT